MKVQSARATMIQFYPMAAGESPGVIISRLNREWEEYAQQVPTWASNCATMAMVLHSIRFDPDRVLSELISACQKGDRLAGRVIVQALLPKIILMASTNPYPPIEHILSALWIRIAHYRLDRRPCCVAANLTLDARKDAVAECRVRVSAPQEHVEDQEKHTAEEIIDTARDLRLATSQSLNIVEKVYVDGLPSAQVASLYNMSPAAVRRRCSDTVRRLRDQRHLLYDVVAG
ncbi:MAG: hypothetical protein FWG15_07915 [Propionibacteriaceae bacterium]|nr:hypothetical protein [Propionibacteriaceae bacterium]